MSTKRGSGMGRDRTRIGRIERIRADLTPDFKDKSVSFAQSASSAFYFAAQYSVQIEILFLLYDDLSSFFAKAGTVHPSRIAAAVWATMEIAANIVEHGHPQPKPDAGFHVEATIHLDHIEIILRDCGLGFDPTLLTQAVLPTEWQTHQRGGLGLSLARRAVDELSYAREDGVNVWKFVVRSA
ncbi:hypothetical protein GC175_27510 [bacterium]|nr:hypothetical protein [bacterium]